MPPVTPFSRKIVIILCCVALAGCVSQPVLSRDEWLNLTNRTYESVNKEQAIAAAEKLLRLADGNDFLIVHNDDGFVATRNWSVYLVLAASVGSDTWVVRTSEISNGTRVSISVGTQMGSVTGVPTGGSTAAPFTTPTVAGGVNGTALYDVFWARMDYLLGRREIWMTCAAANRRISDGVVWGDNSALCNGFNVNDDVPKGARIREDMTPEQERKWREEELIRQNSY